MFRFSIKLDVITETGIQLWIRHKASIIIEESFFGVTLCFVPPKTKYGRQVTNPTALPTAPQQNLPRFDWILAAVSFGVDGSLLDADVLHLGIVVARGWSCETPGKKETIDELNQ